MLSSRGGEWYPENRGPREFLIRSRNLGNFCDESRSLVFHVFLSVSESRIFFGRPRSLGFVACVASVPVRFKRKENSARVLAARKMGRAQKMKRGGGGKEGRERLHPTIVNLKYSVRQPTEPLIGSKLDR